MTCLQPALACLLTACCLLAHAAPTEEEARQLGTTLTEVGAIRAGNAEGTIPPYTGGLATPPAGYAPQAGKRGGAPYLDPYAAEKPLFTIDAKNMAQYADKLDEGSKLLLQRFPATYRMHVYPTHRSAALPRFALENTVKNVMKPRLVGDGVGIEGAHAQVPFPIPKSGAEALWNYQLRYYPPLERGGGPIWLIDAAGNRIQLSDDMVTWEHAYWDNRRTQAEFYVRLVVEQGWPASRAGAKSVSQYPLRADQRDFTAWVYIPGQRRVRLAPEVKYDAVLSPFGGLLFADEAGSLFGRLDRFDYKLLGRREMFVPYNAYRLAQTPVADGTLPQHHDPAVLRFELHRVWVVEGTPKAGQRHRAPGAGAWAARQRVPLGGWRRHLAAAGNRRGHQPHRRHAARRWPPGARQPGRATAHRPHGPGVAGPHAAGADVAERRGRKRRWPCTDRGGCRRRAAHRMAVTCRCRRQRIRSRCRWCQTRRSSMRAAASRSNG
jgi:hypothetical protein